MYIRITQVIATILLFIGTIVIQPADAAAAVEHYSVQSIAKNQADAPLKIGILVPTDGITSAYEVSLRTAIDVVEQQIKENSSLPQIELVEAELVNNESQNESEIEKLIEDGVGVIIAPNFLSALITASSSDVDVLPLITRVNSTHELSLTGESSLYSNLSEHSVIVRAVQKLKFRGRLDQVVVMYDPSDPFGRFGYEIVVDVLSNEKASFSTEIFSAGNIDFLEKLTTFKEENPHTTVIIVGKTEDVADVILQAQDEIGLTGNVLGFIGDGNPTIFDLADEIEDEHVSGMAWDVVPQQEVSNLVTSRFNNDRFAAETYLAIWSVIRSIDEGAPATRAGIRQALTEHEGHNLEGTFVESSAWLYRLVRNAINDTVLLIEQP